MGWAAKGIIFVIALWTLEAGAVLLGITLMLYVFSGFWHGRTLLDNRPKGPTTSVAKLAAVVLFCLSVAALSNGGTFSPALFAAGGFGSLLYAKEGARSVRPMLGMVKGSLVLRDRLLLFRWYLIAEVKMVTSHPSKPLSSVQGTLVIRAEGKAKAFVVLETISVSRGDAEARLGHRLGDAARCLTPLGAYLFPLEGEEALAAVTCSGKRVELGEGQVERGLLAFPCAVISADVSGQNVKRIAVFGGKEGRRTPVLPSRRVRGPLTLWELVSALEKRLEWESPDDTTTFLSSVAATKGGAWGDRLQNVGAPGANTLLVKSLRTPALELTKSQMRILMEIYS
jgi:hypothetical protein